MGFPMAAHLVRAGHDVTVHNRSPSKAADFVRQHGAKMANTAAEAARDAEFIFSCVGNDEDVRSVTLGDDGAFAAMEVGAVFVDHTTTSAQLARDLAAEATKRGFAFLDAPVSGGQIGAEQGRLSIMVGGEEAVFARATPVMSAYAKAITRIGPPGSGQLTKAVNQICLAGLTQALAEALAFAGRCELDGTKVLAAISQGAAQSWMMDNRARTMLEDRFDFGFAVDWMRKDLAIALAEARLAGAVLPVTALVDQFYGELQREEGGGRRDISSLIRLVR